MYLLIKSPCSVFCKSGNNIEYILASVCFRCYKLSRFSLYTLFNVYTPDIVNAISKKCIPKYSPNDYGPISVQCHTYTFFEKSYSIDSFHTYQHKLIFHKSI